MDSLNRWRKSHCTYRLGVIGRVPQERDLERGGARRRERGEERQRERKLERGRMKERKRREKKRKWKTGGTGRKEGEREGIKREERGGERKGVRGREGSREREKGRRGEKEMKERQNDKKEGERRVKANSQITREEREREGGMEGCRSPGQETDCDWHEKPGGTEPGKVAQRCAPTRGTASERRRACCETRPVLSRSAASHPNVHVIPCRDQPVRGLIRLIGWPVANASPHVCPVPLLTQ